MFCLVVYIFKPKSEVNFMECFYVNDRKLFLNQSFSVNDLLVFLNLNIDLIVIKYNKIILPKSLWKQTMIKNNDEVEFVTIVGGG